MSPSARIIRNASIAWSVTEDEILGRRRFERVCMARWSVMAALYGLGWHPDRIADRLNRHRTTVLYGLGLLSKSAFQYPCKIAGEE